MILVNEYVLATRDLKSAKIAICRMLCMKVSRLEWENFLNILAFSIKNFVNWQANLLKDPMICFFFFVVSKAKLRKSKFFVHISYCSLSDREETP